MATQTKQQQKPDRVCADCGARESETGRFCPMSDEGEGPHQFVSLIRSSRLPSERYGGDE